MVGNEYIGSHLCKWSVLFFRWDDFRLFGSRCESRTCFSAFSFFQVCPITGCAKVSRIKDNTFLRAFNTVPYLHLHLLTRWYESLLPEGLPLRRFFFSAECSSRSGTSNGASHVGAHPNTFLIGGMGCHTVSHLYVVSGNNLRIRVGSFPQTKPVDFEQTI